MGSSTYRRTESYADRVAENRPIIGGAAREAIQRHGGAGQIVAGVFTGDKDRIKEGAKNLGKGLLSHLTMGALSGMNEPPQKQYYGGSAQNAQEIAIRDQKGIAQGTQIRDHGVSVIGKAVDQAAENRHAAQNITSDATGAYNTGMGGQDAALAASQQAAQRDVGSIAAAQQAQANQQQNMAMQAQAAQARGGNQAAALRGAQAQGSANSLQTAQSLGQLRLGEEQARRALEVQDAQFRANQMGDRAQLGFGAALGGVGAASTATGQTGQFGAAEAGVGVASTGQYLNQEQERLKAQLAADTPQAAAAKKSQGGILGLGGKVVGAIVGGGGGLLG